MTLPLRGLALVAVLAGPVAAGDFPDGLRLGVGASYGGSVYRGADATVGAIPLLRYESETFSISGEGLGLKLVSGSSWNLKALARPRLRPFETDDAPILGGMERDHTLDLGGALRFPLVEGADFEVRFLQEVTGEHDGQEVMISLTQSIRGPLPVRATVGASWASEALSGYLFGVDASEARVGRPAYDPGNTLTPFVSLGTGVAIAENIGIIGGVRLTAHPDATTGSPIVDEDYSFSAFTGIAYEF